MIKKIKENKKMVKRVLLIALCILVSFYIIYKLSSSIFMVVTGSIILLIGAFVKDPEIANVKEETSKEEELTAFQEEVLEPVIALTETKNKKKARVAAVEKKPRKKNKTVIDIENTNSYKFDEIDKKIKKSKKVKA